MATSIYTGEKIQEVSESNISCTYCAEKATEIIGGDVPMCGIPGNHPDMESSGDIDNSR